MIVAALALSGCTRPHPPPPRLAITLALFPDEAGRYRDFLADFEHRYLVRVLIDGSGGKRSG